MYQVKIKRGFCWVTVASFPTLDEAHRYQESKYPNEIVQVVRG